MAAGLGCASSRVRFTAIVKWRRQGILQGLGAARVCIYTPRLHLYDDKTLTTIKC